MSDRKYVSYTIGTVDNTKNELTIALPFTPECKFKLLKPENETMGGPAFAVLYKGNRVGSLFVPEKGPAFQGPIAFPALHDGRVRMADLNISIWPPDEEKGGRINVTMSQIKDLDTEGEVVSTEPPQGAMFS